MVLGFDCANPKNIKGHSWNYPNNYQKEEISKISKLAHVQMLQQSKVYEAKAKVRKMIVPQRLSHCGSFDCRCK